jgi:hypothetical protein
MYKRILKGKKEYTRGLRREIKHIQENPEGKIKKIGRGQKLSGRLSLGLLVGLASNLCCKIISRAQVVKKCHASNTFVSFSEYLPISRLYNEDCNAKQKRY